MVNKYHAKKTTIDGIRFDSQREGRRYLDLKLLLRGKVISGLKLQVRFPLTINGFKICDYIADFTYEENGEQIIEDCKGMRTYHYKLKKKLMFAIYNITIKET